MKYEYHEYANLFPMMLDSEIESLAKDIIENGQMDPIILCDGKILDGRNRFKACEIAKIKPTFKQYDGGDPLAFVMSHNLSRRHLSPSQLSMVAAKWAKLKVGNPNLIPPVGGIGTTETKTRDEAAKLLGVGTSSIDRAKKVIRDAPELAEMVERGDMTVNSAYEKTKQREEPRAVVMEKVPHKDNPRKTSVSISFGMAIWGNAKAILDTIIESDKERAEALTAAMKYAQNRIERNK